MPNKFRNGTSSNGSRRDELIKKLVKLRGQAEKDGLEKERVRQIFLKSWNSAAEVRAENKFEDGESNANSASSGLAPVVDRVWSFLLYWLFSKVPAKKNTLVYVFSLIFPVMLAFLLMLYTADFSFTLLVDDVRAMPCLVDTNFMVMEITRPVENCDICRGFDSVPVVENLSREEFLERHAYSGVPVLVTGATANWTAMQAFNFSFFKQLYEGIDGALLNVEEECQFFPYNTEFRTLAEVFNMTEDRAAFKENERTWYVGWSNCHPEVASVLREHYERPYFLPVDSESSALDWIFMGGSGIGANIHLDFVQRPSWQAQISGQKIWTLIPPPECEDVCKESMKVTVNKGDIIVVDTNIWYHSTYVTPGEISITIGSEYD
ncbi:uncharacterized protein LOC100374815 [Saccoglossus kowalevskii]|uniref:Uncharacterized protein LOC100374815 n=1 Tax=Saccoglossus kowalevskii TaxID=10224 RepID=A0ABM0GKH5_SACKO|nr:PREDICTED: uncharacterized protein LOC100374815 [Saccoglossus kowalevskii]